MSVCGAQQSCDLTAREFASIQDGFDYLCRPWRQLVGLNFFVCPLQDAPSQLIRLDQLLHEPHLVKARVEEELRKSGERLLAQRAPSIEIVSSLLVARHKVPFVRRLVSGEPSCDGPDSPCLQGVQQHRMRHQPGDASVPVEKGVNPQHAVMRSRGSQNRFGPPKATVDTFETFKKAQYSTGAHRDVTTDLHVATTERPRHHRHCVAGLRVVHRQQLRWQQLAEVFVNLPDRFNSHRASRQPALIDPALNGDVSLGFKLQTAFTRIGTVVIPHRPLDVDRVSVVTFNQVRVVTVHGADQIGERLHHTGRQASAESGRCCREFDGQISQGRPVARAFWESHRLHQADLLPSVFCRFYVRFYVLQFFAYNAMYSR